MSGTTRISQLNELGDTPADDDLLLITDVSDQTQSPQGSTKKITAATFLQSAVDAASSVVTAITIGDDPEAENFSSSAQAGQLFYDTNEGKMYIALTTAGRSPAYVVPVVSSSSNTVTNADGTTSSVFNVDTRDTESNLFSSSYNVPSNSVILALGTDTNNLYVFHDATWKTYESDTI